MSSCRLSLLCCVTWLCYYVIGVNYRKTIRPPPLLSSLIARDGNHCSWSNRCPFSQSTSWEIHIKYFFSTFSFLCDIKLSHSTLASQRLVPPIQFWCPSQVATVTWRHAVSRNVTQRSIREREAWQHIPRTAPSFISILSRGGEHKWRGENVTLCYVLHCDAVTISLSWHITLAGPGKMKAILEMSSISFP